MNYLQFKNYIKNTCITYKFFIIIKFQLFYKGILVMFHHLFQDFHVDIAVKDQIWLD